jgi:hypothetical protein
MEAGGNAVTILYRSILLVVTTFIEPSSPISIPSPQVILSCLFDKALLILDTA